MRLSEQTSSGHGGPPRSTAITNCTEQLHGSSVCTFGVPEVRQPRTLSALSISVEARWQGVGGCHPPLPIPLHALAHSQRFPSTRHLNRFWQSAPLNGESAQAPAASPCICSAEASPYLAGAPAARRSPVHQGLAGAAASAAAQGQHHLRLAGPQVGAPERPAHRAHVGRFAAGTAGQDLGGERREHGERLAPLPRCRHGGAGAAGQTRAPISHRQRSPPLSTHCGDIALSSTLFLFLHPFFPPPTDHTFCSHPFAGSEEHQECFSDRGGHVGPREGTQDRETSP